MCFVPKTPKYTYSNSSEQVQIKQSTQADASVQKSGEIAKRQLAGLSNESIKTSALGLEDNPATKKTKLGE